MPTVETIGTGGDYATPQAWYDAHKGDITSDDNAPYIGEMLSETFTNGLTMSESVTNSTHYFKLVAKEGHRFTGNFGGSYPVIKGLGANDAILDIQDDYSRFEYFVVGNQSVSPTGPHAHCIKAYDGLLCQFNGVGIYNVTYNRDYAGSIVLYCFNMGSMGQTLIRNCSVAACSVNNSNATNNATIYGFYTLLGTSVYYYNNAVQGLTANAGGSSIVYGFYEQQTSSYKIINNIIGTLTGDTTTCIAELLGSGEKDYNATTDSTGGSNGQSLITPANEFVDINNTTIDLHLKPTGQCRNNGINLIEESYIGAPLIDCDSTARPETGSWDIGIDYPFDSMIIIDDGSSVDFSGVIYTPGLVGFVPLLRSYIQCCPVNVNIRLRYRFDNKDYYKRTE